MKKKLAAVALCLTMAAGALTACGSQSSSSEKTTQAAAGSQAQKEAAGSESQAAGQSDGEAADLSAAAGIAESPVLLTSVGQSADVNVVQTLMTKAGIESDLNATVTADGLTGYKTLVLAIGGSSKGLGAAGVDEDQEIERVKALIAKAEEEGVTVVALHIGGSARRGTLSDKFIPDALNAADAAIIVSEGDSDGLMSGIVSGNGTPTAFIDNQVDAIEPLQTIFGAAQ